jgi:predicted DNA-binding transcriptional regulator AlpA
MLSRPLALPLCRLGLMPELFIRAKTLCAQLGIVRPTLWQWCKEGRFPQPYRLSNRPGGAVAWKVSEVDEWIANRQQGFGQPAPHLSKRHEQQRTKTKV